MEKVKSLMKKQYDLITVIPIGPNCKIEYILDTLNSIRFYCDCSLKFILADDSKKNTGNLIKLKFPDIDILNANEKYGLAGGLYVNLSLAFKHAIEHYTFNSLLRIDTDAMVIGPNPQKDAERMFKSQPNIGIAGLHIMRHNMYDFNNNKVDNQWPRNHLIRATCTWRIIKRPIGNLILRRYFLKALNNGYEIGENIFGGAYFITERLLHQLNEAKLLPDYRLQNSRLEEDHLFSLLTKVVGFDLGDLASGNLPFACAWKTLPASPEELNLKGKKIIHSTRAWGNIKEDEIRSYFRDIRNVIWVPA